MGMERATPFPGVKGAEPLASPLPIRKNGRRMAVRSFNTLSDQSYAIMEIISSSMLAAVYH